MQVPRSMDAGVLGHSSRLALFFREIFLLLLMYVLIISFIPQLIFCLKRLESCDDFEPTTQLTSCRSDAEYVYRDHSTFKKRTLTPLPKNFNNFIGRTVIPSFEKQRLTGYQFAVVILLSENNFYNIWDTRFVPSNDGQPILQNCHPSMPQNIINYGNYIVARPINNSWHSEEEIFGSSINSHFCELWTAYMKRNHSTPKCVLLYTWNLPCSRCTDVIIRSLNDNMYRCTSVIVAHTIYWRSESEDTHRKNIQKLRQENITVEQVPYPKRLSPALSTHNSHK